MTDPEELEDAVLKLRFRIAERIGVSAGMTVVDMGCGQGGFTAALARLVGERGKVLAIDISDEYLAMLNELLEKGNVRKVVTFILADAASLEKSVQSEVADVTASYRLLEELKPPEAMTGVVKEMARVTKKDGKVTIIEISTRARNAAEENYIRLHRESGDSLFEPEEIIRAMKAARIAEISTDEFETDIWFSPELAKQNLEYTQVWFDENVGRSLESSIEEHGMKYPNLLIFSGLKNREASF